MCAPTFVGRISLCHYQLRIREFQKPGRVEGGGAVLGGGGEFLGLRIALMPLNTHGFVVSAENKMHIIHMHMLTTNNEIIS